jgi:hypothetical protein
MEILLSIIASVLSGIVLAALLGIWSSLRRFTKEQREQNEAQRQFMRSQQRAELVRYFRIVVENGDPITMEEMEHLDACYNAYHAHGGNGTGTLMFERIKEHVHLVTQVSDEKIGGTE